MSGGRPSGPRIQGNFAVSATSLLRVQCEGVLHFDGFLCRVRIYYAVHLHVGVLTLERDDEVVEVGIGAGVIEVLIAANKDGIRPRAPSAGDHMRDPVQLKPLVVMNVAVEDDEFCVGGGRLGFEIMTQREYVRGGNPKHESGLQIRDQRDVEEEENKVR